MKPVFSTAEDLPTPPRLISTPSDLVSGAALIASGTRAEQERFLADLSRDELRALPYLFDFWALPHQVPPGGDWKTWVILGGRGAGKTRAGAEWVRSEVEGSLPDAAGRARRLAIIGETYDQARDVMIFGESGIMACTPPDRTPRWSATERKLTWPNGAVAHVFSAHDFEALRGPQFDCAWVDEIGCAAIDRGTNQPNKFLDPKSSESSLPKHSNGGRDDLIQVQYLRALREFWTDPTNNPASATYGGKMVDPARMFVWAWDARPYPFFPGTPSVWSDGDNYARGHWLNGRATSRSLSSVVTDICADSGLTDVDTSALYGVVRGYSPAPGEGTRASLQSLLLAFGADAVERDGKLVLRTRHAAPKAVVSMDMIAWGEGASLMSCTRAPEAEISGRVRLSFIEADADYEMRAVDSIFPDEASVGVSETELSIALTAGEARSAVDRWLSEARVARDVAAFSLPPSSDMGAGDVLRIDAGDVRGLYRVDRIEENGLKQIEAVRIEPGVYEAAAIDETIPVARPVSVALPVWAEVVDLPTIAGFVDDEAPWIAAAAEPWPGEVAVYSSRDGTSWRLETTLSRRAVIGQTLADLPAAVPGTWDRGPALDVRFVSASLSSIDDATLFAGGNTALIFDQGSGRGEVFQFRDATLVGPETWALGMRLRGQHGTDGLMPSTWSAGATVIVLDTALAKATLVPGLMDGPRLYRIGPASKPVDHGSYVEVGHHASGLALTPYRPAHLRAERQADGSDLVTWIRRTRIDGDGWSLADVPLGEVSETYRVQVIVSGTVRREVTVASPVWTYTAADKATDGVGTLFTIEVAQISDRVGPGHKARIDING